MINWWAITTIGIWFSCALATKWAKGSSNMMYAIGGSVLLGFLYCIVNNL